MRLDPLSNFTRIAEPGGQPTRFYMGLHQRIAEKLEGLEGIGELDDLPGGASLADVIAKVNAILALVRAIP